MKPGFSNLKPLLTKTVIYNLKCLKSQKNFWKKTVANHLEVKSIILEVIFLLYILLQEVHNNVFNISQKN